MDIARGQRVDVAMHKVQCVDYIDDNSAAILSPAIHRVLAGLGWYSLVLETEYRYSSSHLMCTVERGDWRPFDSIKEGRKCSSTCPIFIDT